MSPRAKEYREIHNIKGIRGTAITVQAMVFGNMGMDSGAGKVFTRKSWTGEKIPAVDFRDMQDIEFTVEEGKLFILQSRSGKRSPLAALRTAVDLEKEGLISPGSGKVEVISERPVELL
jgi:pyruvate, orthophosphate dikinase